MDDYELNLGSISDDPVINKSDYRLCDFYVASSYKSFLPCTNWYDYASTKSIEKILKCGARLIDLDVFNKELCPCTEPVVCAGREVGNWHWTTEESFADCIKTISNLAFSSEVKNPNDPLFICLNFNVWENWDTMEKCAQIIKEVLGHRLLPIEYGYYGKKNKNDKYNISLTKITELFGKVIIISNGDLDPNSKMEEITNIYTGKGGNLRNLTFTQVKNTFDSETLIQNNKTSLAMVTPDFIEREKQNFYFFTPWYLGCQFICMNYTSTDEIMKAYIDKFNKNSFVLKPYRLRYQPLTTEAPLQQTKAVSFAPRTVVNPNYSLVY